MMDQIPIISSHIFCSLCKLLASHITLIAFEMGINSALKKSLPLGLCSMIFLFFPLPSPSQCMHTWCHACKHSCCISLWEKRNMGRNPRLGGGEGDQLRCHYQCLQGHQLPCGNSSSPTLLICSSNSPFSAVYFPTWCGNNSVAVPGMTLTMVSWSSTHSADPWNAAAKGHSCPSPVCCFSVSSLAKLCHTMLFLPSACAQGSILFGWKYFWSLSFLKILLFV